MAAVVAWRLRRLPTGGVAMLHQRARSSAVAVEATGYAGSGGECDIGVTAPAISRFPSPLEEACVPLADGQPCAEPAVVGGAALSGVTLAVDFAVSAVGSLAYLAVAESDAAAATRASPSAYVYLSELESDCVSPREGGMLGRHAVTAVEALADGTQVRVHRDPFEVIVQGGARFYGTSLENGLGHDIFHAATESRVACASCHPEGHEDGHVWRLGIRAEPRRTQSVLGGVLSTAPFHWSGDVPGLFEIMESSFVERMGGRPLSPEEVEAVGQWLDVQPTPPGSSVDPDAETRGRAHFADATTGCADCHTDPGPQSVNVGTGGAFQIPTLSGVALRAPYLHDGCAATLHEVLTGECSLPDAHGVTSHLAESARADLVAYLRSL